jgi:hypothetical protein
LGPSNENQSRLKEKSGFSSSLPPVRQLYGANFPPTQAAEMLCRLRFFQVFPLCKDRHTQCGFCASPLETGKGKTEWLLLPMGLLASPPPMLMN